MHLYSSSLPKTLEHQHNPTKLPICYKEGLFSIFQCFQLGLSAEASGSALYSHHILNTNLHKILYSFLSVTSQALSPASTGSNHSHILRNLYNSTTVGINFSISGFRCSRKPTMAEVSNRTLFLTVLEARNPGNFHV